MTMEGDILNSSHVVAVVGLSADRERPSYRVASYLQQKGYRIIPVNPKEKEILGEASYPDILSIPGPVDVVDIFRRPGGVPPVIDEAIMKGAKVVWMQEGVINEEAAARAEKAGLAVVMDRCMMKEHKKLKGEAPR